MVAVFVVDVAFQAEVVVLTSSASDKLFLGKDCGTLELNE